MSSTHKEVMQEVFDIVFKHLWEQGGKANGLRACATGVNYSSMYWNKETGFKCAIGCLIPEDSYTPEIEGQGVWGVINTHPNVIPKKYHSLYIEPLDEKSRSFLVQLQAIHDNFDPEITDSQQFFEDYLICEFDSLADEFDLSYEVLVKVSK